MTELLNLILFPKKFTLKIICFQIQELMSQAYLFKEKQNAKPWHRILLTEACIPSPASSLDFPQELWGHFRNYTVTELKKKKKRQVRTESGKLEGDRYGSGIVPSKCK